MTQQLNDIEQKFRDEEEALFAQCEEKCGTPISKMSLRNIRKAAKTMLASGAKINNSTIAAFIQNLDNSDLFEKTEKENVPPKYQSIANNANFKAFISFYVIEQDKRMGTKKRTTVSQRNESSFPVDQLDPKSRAYVRTLQMQVQALENERKVLTAKLQEQSRKQPISLALSHQTTAEKGLPTLEVISDTSAEDALLAQIISKLVNLPEQFPEYFQTETRNEKTVLKIVSNSRKQVLFRSDEWKYITDALTGRSHE